MGMSAGLLCGPALGGACGNVCSCGIRSGVYSVWGRVFRRVRGLVEALCGCSSGPGVRVLRGVESAGSH